MLIRLTEDQKSIAAKTIKSAFHSRFVSADEWDYSQGLVDWTCDSPDLIRDVYDDVDKLEDRKVIFRNSEADYAIAGLHTETMPRFVSKLNDFANRWAEAVITIAQQKCSDEEIDDLICDETAITGALCDLNISPFDPMVRAFADCHLKGIERFLEDRLGYMSYHYMMYGRQVILGSFDHLFGESFTVESLVQIGRCMQSNKRSSLLKEYEIRMVLYNDPMLEADNPEHFLRHAIDDELFRVKHEIEDEADEIRDEARYYDYT